MNNPILRAKLLRGGLVLLAAVLFVILFVVYTPVRVQLPENSDGYSISPFDKTYKDKDAGKAGLRFVKRGTYLVRYYQGDTVTAIRLWKPSLLPFGSLKVNTDTTRTATATAFMGQTADYVTPLGTDQYIFIDRRSKAVAVASAQGVQNVSSKFVLSNQQSSIYNTAIAITPLGSGSVVVTTTKGAFIYTSAGEALRLKNPSGVSDFNFTASTYDDKTKTVLFLNAYDKTIYSYDVSANTGALQAFYNLPKIAKSINAGGGKVVAYDGDLPTTDSAAVQKYGERQQTEPLVLDISSKQESAKLDTFVAPALALPSGGSGYMLVKEKFATTMQVYNLQTKDTVQIPAYDVSGVAWSGDTVYFGRDNAIWSYTVGTEDQDIQKVAELGSPATRLIIAGNTLIAATTANVSYAVRLGDTSANDTIAQQLANIKLYDSDHITSFTALGGTLLVNTQSLSAAQGGDIGDGATATIRTIRSAFPSLQPSETVNEQPFPGYYYYGFIGE